MVNSKNIEWIRHQRRRLTLRASMISEPQQFDMWINEDDMVEIATWCELNQCGKRISFDMFSFRTREQLTMFLLRWS